MVILNQISTGLLKKLADLFGAPEDALRLFISLLLGFPLALIHRYTLFGKDPIKQHIFFVVCGLLLGFWNYAWNILHIISALCITYVIIKAFGGTKRCVFVSFLFNMGYLSYGYYTTSTGEYDMKWTMPQCVLTLRLIGLVFNLWDGSKPESELSDFQKKTALKKHPSFLEMAGFSFFPCSFLVGPQFSMRRYQDYVHNNLIEKKENTHELPDCLIPGIKRIILGLIYVSLFQIGSQYLPENYLLTPKFERLSFLSRFFVIGIWGHIIFYKYISCWLITEGACISFGLAYNGKDKEGRIKWDGCENVKLLRFENATEFDHYIQSFNINTNHWSAEYIYKRLKFLGSKLYSQIFTLTFLAIWHGFHSGYYVCFIMEFIIMYFEKDISSIIKKHERLQMFVNKNAFIKIASWILLKIYTTVFMGYSLVPFVYLSYTKYMRVFRSVYFNGHIIFFAYPILAPLIKRAIRSKPSRSHQE